MERKEKCQLYRRIAFFTHYALSVARTIATLRTMVNWIESENKLHHVATITHRRRYYFSVKLWFFRIVRFDIILVDVAVSMSCLFSHSVVLPLSWSHSWLEYHTQRPIIHLNAPDLHIQTFVNNWMTIKFRVSTFLSTARFFCLFKKVCNRSTMRYGASDFFPISVIISSLHFLSHNSTHTQIQKPSSYKWVIHYGKRLVELNWIELIYLKRHVYGVCVRVCMYLMQEDWEWMDFDAYERMNICDEISI